MSTSKPVLGYWSIRGYAEPIRLMLEHAGVDYDQKLYHIGEAPDYNTDMWKNVKESMGMDFPNLPYYIDGDFKLCESLAIMKHVAQGHNMLPEGVEASAKCNQAEGVILDFRASWLSACYRPDEGNNKKNFFASLPVKMARFDKYLGSHKWMSGEKLTYVDFAFCEVLDQLQTMENDVYSKYPNVAEYLKNFMALERIAAYRSSPKFKKFPCNGPMAKWGGGKTQD